MNTYLPAVGDMVLASGGRRLCEVMDTGVAESGAILVKLDSLTYTLTGYHRPEWQEFQPEEMPLADAATIETHINDLGTRAKRALTRVEKLRSKRNPE